LKLPQTLNRFCKVAFRRGLYSFKIKYKSSFWKQGFNLHGFYPKPLKKASEGEPARPLAGLGGVFQSLRI